MAYAFNDPKRLKELFSGSSASDDAVPNSDTPEEWHDPGKWWDD